MKFAFILQAVRAYSFPASIVPILVGSGYAYWLNRSFDLSHFTLSLVAGLAYHVAVNLLNDVYDYKRGVDIAGSFGGSGVLVARSASPESFMQAAYGAITLGTFIGLYFVYLYGIPMLLLGALGLAGVIGYTRNGFAAKYVALGLPLVAFTMGSGMVLGGYLTQTGRVDVSVLIVSIPIALMVAAILQANDTRDITFDRRASITTLATLIGPTGARTLLSALMFSTFIAILFSVFQKFLPPHTLAALLALPQAISIHNQAWRNTSESSKTLATIVEKTAKLHLAVGVLLSLGLLVASL